jgi:hypothetical protein
MARLALARNLTLLRALNSSSITIRCFSKKCDYSTEHPIWHSRATGMFSHFVRRYSHSEPGNVLWQVGSLRVRPCYLRASCLGSQNAANVRAGLLIRRFLPSPRLPDGNPRLPLKPLSSTTTTRRKQQTPIIVNWSGLWTRAYSGRI